jgi:hypothetical protein
MAMKPATSTANQMPSMLSHAIAQPGREESGVSLHNTGAGDGIECVVASDASTTDSTRYAWQSVLRTRSPVKSPLTTELLRAVELA